MFPLKESVKALLQRRHLSVRQNEDGQNAKALTGATQIVQYCSFPATVIFDAFGIPGIIIEIRFRLQRRAHNSALSRQSVPNKGLPYPTRPARRTSWPAPWPAHRSTPI